MSDISLRLTHSIGCCIYAYSTINYVSQEVVFKYEISDYIFPIILFLSSSLTSFILLFRVKNKKFGFSFLFFAILIGFFMIPSMVTVNVSVYNNRIEQVTGFWGYNKTKGFNFDDVDYIHILTEGNSSKKILWNVKHRDGINDIIDISDIWERHSAEIISLLKGYGVHFKS